MGSADQGRASQEHAGRPLGVVALTARAVRAPRAPPGAPVVDRRAQRLAEPAGAPVASADDPRQLTVIDRAVLLECPRDRVDVAFDPLRRLWACRAGGPDHPGREESRARSGPGAEPSQPGALIVAAAVDLSANLVLSGTRGAPTGSVLRAYPVVLGALVIHLQLVGGLPLLGRIGQLLGSASLLCTLIGPRVVQGRSRSVAFGAELVFLLPLLMHRRPGLVYARAGFGGLACRALPGVFVVQRLSGERPLLVGARALTQRSGQARVAVGVVLALGKECVGLALQGEGAVVGSGRALARCLPLLPPTLRA